MRVEQATAVKICGVTTIDQAKQIADLGVNAIGLIGVKKSTRYVSASIRESIFNEIAIRNPLIERVWVVSDIKHSELDKGIKSKGSPSIIQLHGQESKEECKYIKTKYPHIKLWKALRVRGPEDFLLGKDYEQLIDALLLDSWSPKELGGTGKTIPIEWFSKVNFAVPWWLAGGISAECVNELIAKANPFGVDASSKLEISPGIKDINKVKDLLKALKRYK